MVRTVFTLGLACSLFACGQPERADYDLLDPGGKADDPNVTSLETAEPLEFETLQRIACEAVAMNTEQPDWATRNAIIEGCSEDFVFTITSKQQSNLYQHTNSRRPVTLAMKVQLDSADASFEATLFRVMGGENRFVWRGTVADGISDDDYVAGLAEASGADIDPPGLAWQFKVRGATYAEIPHGVVSAAEAEVAALNGSDPAPTFDHAELGADPARLFRVDDTVGFAIPVEVVLEDEVEPIHAALYYNSAGELVKAVPEGLF